MRQTYTGDIGLKGVRVRRKAGTRDGFDVFLGGGVHGPVELGLPLPQGGRHRPAPRGDRRARPHLRPRVTTATQTFSQFWRDRLARPATSPRSRRPRRTTGPTSGLCETCGHRHRATTRPVFCPQLRGAPQELRPARRTTRPAADPSAEPVARDAPAPTASATSAHADTPPRRPAGRAGRRPRAGAVPGRRARSAASTASAPTRAARWRRATWPTASSTCPWHGWAFRTRRPAQPADGNACPLRTYPVKVEDGRVLVPGRRAGIGPGSRRGRGPGARAQRRRGGRGDARHADDPAGQRRPGRSPVHRPGQHVKVSA